MKTLAFMLAIATVGAHAQSATYRPLVECVPEICGGYEQNRATLGLEGPSGTVYTESSRPGQLSVAVMIYDKRTNLPVENKTLEVHYGILADGVVRTQLLGTFTSGPNGRYDGPVWAAQGVPFRFPSGTTLTGSFMINDPAIPNTQFISGMYVY